MGSLAVNGCFITFKIRSDQSLSCFLSNGIVAERAQPNTRSNTNEAVLGLAALEKRQQNPVSMEIDAILCYQS